MHCSLAHFSLPKLGNDSGDYEDAFSPKGYSGGLNLSVAIADGATESSFASEWARMLARAFAKEPLMSIDLLKTRTEDLSRRWHSVVTRKPLQWYAEEKIRSGAFSTLLGAQIATASNGSSLDGGRWSAIAIGDSCLFQVRQDKLLTSFPLQKSIEFGNSPTLLSSNLSRNSEVWGRVKEISSRWELGDLFFLATDALASWFLSQHEQDQKPWHILLNVCNAPNSEQSFKIWADDLRINAKMKNDDVTLLLLKL